MPLTIDERALQAMLKNLSNGMTVGSGLTSESRYLGQMATFYRESVENRTNEVVYDVLTWPHSERDTDLLITITVLYPGMVGNEHFHTKGHFHNDPDGPEFVLGYQGTGLLEMVNRAGEADKATVAQGTHVWIPSGTAHRMVNESSDPVVYLSVSSAGVGHDYESVLACEWRYDQQEVI